MPNEAALAVGLGWLYPDLSVANLSLDKGVPAGA